MNEANKIWANRSFGRVKCERKQIKVKENEMKDKNLYTLLFSISYTER